MQFKNLIGQHATRQKIQELIAADRLPHALMLSGQTGYGTMAMAMAIAQQVMCLAPRAEDSCGQCKQCIKMQALQHPDLLLSFPTVSQNKPSTAQDFLAEFGSFITENPYAGLSDWMMKLNAENKQANITALEARRIIDRLSLKNIESQHKIMIMWLPEYLGKESNILLKLIEEPTPNTLLLFVTEDKSRLLDTVKSRLQEIALPPIDQEAIQRALEAERGPDPKWEQISRMADGDYRRALELMEGQEDPRLDTFKTWLNVLFTNRMDLQVEWVEELNSHSRPEIIAFFDFALQNLENLLAYLHGRHEQIVASELEFLEKLSQRFSDLEVLDRWRAAIEDTRYALQRNTQTKLSLHTICIELQYLNTYHTLK